jgi:hypothetical protein
VSFARLNMDLINIFYSNKSARGVYSFSNTANKFVPAVFILGKVILVFKKLVYQSLVFFVISTISGKVFIT